MLLLFDLDSTVISNESGNNLAIQKGVGSQVAEITTRTMNGELDFNTAFPGKIELISPSIHEQEELGKEGIRQLTPGLIELFKAYQSQGHIVGIITQGYQITANIIAEYLNIPRKYVFGLDFEYDEGGNFESFPEQLLKHEDGKSYIIKSLQHQYPGQKSIFVGDSVGDMKNGGSADIFIGCGIHIVRDTVKSKCTHFVTSIEELDTIIRKNNN